MKNKFILFLSCSLFMISCQSQPNKSIKTLSVIEFSKKLSQTQNVQLLDVRTPEEFKADHLDNAINNNILATDFEAKTQSLNKSKPLFVYCKAGSRSAKAAEKLAALGFAIIYNLDGGLMKWNANEMAKPAEKIIGISAQEYNKLLQANTKIIVNFYAKWCEPCKKMEPYISKLQQELKGKINLVRFDVDQNKTILDALKLDGLPVVIIYENQKEIYRHVGYLSEDDLRKHI